MGATAWSPRGDAIFALTGNDRPAGLGLQIWRVPMNGGAPTILSTQRYAYAPVLSVSEDGTEIEAAVELFTGSDTLEQPPFSHLHCVLEYRNSITGTMLDSIDLGTAGDPCYGSRNIVGSARRIAAAH